MTAAVAYDEVTEAYAMPRLVRLAPNLYGACFTLMKMVPARHILLRAAAAGALEPGTVIVETTSGTFGLALAMLGVGLRRQVVLVSDPVIDERLSRRLTDLGATVDRVPADAGRAAGGFQAARLERLAQLRSRLPATFCPEQYTNPDNPRSYALVAELIAAALGDVDALVGPVGSGGSMSGTGTALRSNRSDCQAIGVDTFGSVVFGQPDGSRELRGLGMSIMPRNVDHRVFDQVHWCTAGEAYTATRELHRRTGLFMGPTSGAAYLVGRWWAARHPDGLGVVMMPDEGYRYQDTVYDDAWLAGRGCLGHVLPAEPAVTADPAGAGPTWTAFDWNRRDYDRVMASTPAIGVG